MAITSPPTPPSRSDPTNFAARGDAFFAWFGTFVSEVNVAITEIANYQVLCAAAAIAAQAAAVSAQTVAPKWVSGTFSDGDPRWAPSNYQTYRKKGSGSGTLDPATDPTNWQAMTRIISTLPVPNTSVTAAAFQRLRLDNVNPTAVMLPPTPNVDDEIVVDPVNGLRTNTVLRNGKKIDGIADDVMLDHPGPHRFIYVGGTTEWRMSYA